jgi:hypothetical protein
LPLSAVQIKLSFAVNPLLLPRNQLHGVSGHTTATRLPGPASEIDPVSPCVEVKLGLAVSTVASPPSCDHAIVSSALRPPGVLTTDTLSARAQGIIRRSRNIEALKLSAVCLSLESPIRRLYMHTAPASIVKVPSLEKSPATPIEGVA